MARTQEKKFRQNLKQKLTDLKGYLYEATHDDFFVTRLVLAQNDKIGSQACLVQINSDIS